jgi:phage baseplate assembly protein gpV
MRWLTQLWRACAEDREWWLPALGLLLVGSGLVVSLVRFIGGGQ